MPPVPLHAHIQKTERGRKPPFTSLLCRRFLVLDQANPPQSREPQETEAEQREGHRLRRLPGRLDAIVSICLEHRGRPAEPGHGSHTRDAGLATFSSTEAAE